MYRVAVMSADIGGTYLKRLSARERPLRYTLHNQFSLNGQLNGGLLPERSWNIVSLHLFNDRSPGPIAVRAEALPLPPPDLGKEKRRSESAACHRIPKMEHSLAITQSNLSQSETCWPNNQRHQFRELACNAYP